MKKICKNDRVIVISGDDRGKEGKVLKVDTENNRAIVESVNFVKRHMRPTQQNPQGGIVEKEAAVRLSNLMVICGKCNAGVKTKMTRLSDGGKVRTCKRCGEMITNSTS